MTSTDIQDPTEAASSESMLVWPVPSPPLVSVPAPMPVGQKQSDNSGATADLEVVIPVYNEEACLSASVESLLEHLVGFPFTVEVTIVDNGSTDSTWTLARELGAAHPGIRAVNIGEKGRGRALRAIWMSSTATVVSYMDVDLSTDLDALLPLVAPILSGHSDIAIGTRLARGSRVVRGPKREFISRSYNMLLRGALGVRFSDAQCGFKAIRTQRAKELLPMVQDECWFFDTELLTIAERAGIRIHEVPVDWVDDPDSRVNVVSTATADLKGIWRLMRGFGSGRISPYHLAANDASDEREVSLWRHVLRFALVGIVSTIVFGVLFLGFRSFLGPQLANVAALLLATVANTAANRRFTFGVRGGRRAVRQQFQGFVVLGLALAITGGSLALLHALIPTVSTSAELVVLTVANLVATVVRFLLFRSWVFPTTERTSK